jgi:hypothetical protein
MRGGVRLLFKPPNWEVEEYSAILCDAVHAMDCVLDCWLSEANKGTARQYMRLMKE